LGHSVFAPTALAAVIVTLARDERENMSEGKHIRWIDTGRNPQAVNLATIVHVVPKHQLLEAGTWMIKDVQVGDLTVLPQKRVAGLVEKTVSRASNHLSVGINAKSSAARTTSTSQGPEVSHHAMPPEKRMVRCWGYIGGPYDIFRIIDPACS
jgi:hypothetical protein